MERDRIVLAGRGDRQAQEQFVEVFYGYVMGFLVKLTMNKELAEDLTQETFIKALRSLPTYRGDSAPGSWLVAIAHNLYRDHMRQSARRAQVTLEDMPLSDEGLGALSMQLTLEAREALSQLQKLTPENRAIVVLRYYYGYNSKDIAEITKLPEGTVRSRLHYALKSIKEGGG